jgi:hypothetical protein
MYNSVTFDRNLIAPCGINCGTCIGYLRDKNKCYGCLPPAENKPKTRLLCRIKNCEHLAKTSSKFCYDCEIFPCNRMKHLDKRYQSKYHTSLIQNLITIKEIGITKYLINEVNRWTCPNCGSILSIHRDKCLGCGFQKPL